MPWAFVWGLGVLELGSLWLGVVIRVSGEVGGCVELHQRLEELLRVGLRWE